MLPLRCCLSSYKSYYRLIGGLVFIFSRMLHVLVAKVATKKKIPLMDVFCRFPVFASLAVLRLSLTSVTGVHLTPLMSVDHLCLPECTSLWEFALVRNLCPAGEKKSLKTPVCITSSLILSPHYRWHCSADCNRDKSHLAPLADNLYGIVLQD